MAQPNGLNPEYDALTVTAQTVIPNSAQGTANVIQAGKTSVVVGANANGVNDFIVLPSLASVPSGHTITIICNAAGMEIRTPEASAQEVNSEDCDGTTEYTVPAGGQIHIFRKIDNTIGWMAQGFTAIGAVVAAIVPDAL